MLECRGPQNAKSWDSKLYRLMVQHAFGPEVQRILIFAGVWERGGRTHSRELAQNKAWGLVGVGEGEDRQIYKYMKKYM